MSNKITIELFPAGNGDAILIDFGTELILIDAGFVSTYKKHLKPRLKELHNAGRRLSKFIVTHIDNDHISGAIAFIKANGDAENPSVIGIDEVWFNSYRHLKFDDKEDGTFNDTPPKISINEGNISIDPDHDEQLVSHNQGTSLGSHILKNKYAWNITFKGAAVKADKPKEINLNADIKLTLLGPTQKALDNLADDWYDYLKTVFHGKINEDDFFDDAFEKMMEGRRQADLLEATTNREELVSSTGDWVEDNAVDWKKEDRSPTNGSSITFLIEFAGKKLLFLGDAIPSQVEDQLKKVLVDSEFPLHVDVLKVAHHGAWSNNSPYLIERIRANYYLFSSNGRSHHHPHFETMAWILKKHGTVSTKTFVFNYKQGDRLLEVNKFQMKQKYNYKTIWPDVNEFGIGRDGYVKLILE